MSAIVDYVRRLDQQLANQAGWSEALNAILAMAADLPPMDPELKTEQTRFHGCQSQIWIVLTFNEETGLIEIIADSDARIMRGLLAVGVGLYGNRAPAEIAGHPPSVLLDTGILSTLAPSRANGFGRLLTRIHRYGVETAERGREAVA
jgi:cysteine desulfuration protein SufE